MNSNPEDLVFFDDDDDNPLFPIIEDEEEDNVVTPPIQYEAEISRGEPEVEVEAQEEPDPRGEAEEDTILYTNNFGGSRQWVTDWLIGTVQNEPNGQGTAQPPQNENEDI